VRVVTDTGTGRVVTVIPGGEDNVIQADHDLLDHVRKALWEKWDPIGVNQCSDATDEYDSYAYGLFQLLKENSDKERVFDYLWTVETESIGLSGNRSATEAFAKWLCDSVDSEKA